METVSISSSTTTNNDGNSGIVFAKKKRIEDCLLTALRESQSINDKFLSYLINMSILELNENNKKYLR